MTEFVYSRKELHVENVSLLDIAKEFGTPTYVYSKSAILKNFSAYQQAGESFGPSNNQPLICFAVKANSNLAILNLLAKQGAGFDIVSGGELMRVLAAGGNPEKVIFSGVGKTADEIKLALTHNIYCFNVESLSELERINEIASEMGTFAPISFRVNPNINARTHPYISTGLKENKFGISHIEALSKYRKAAQMSNIRIVGIDCHIGSQIMEIGPMLEAVDRLIELTDRLAIEGIRLTHIDVGGGLGITYNMEKSTSPQEFVEEVYKKITKWRRDNHLSKSIRVIFEPGRSIVGNAGALLTEVQYLKTTNEKNFAIVDAGMNDLLRPAMYDAWHRVREVAEPKSPSKSWSIVGPICETSDSFTDNRSLSISQGDILSIMSAGAYGMTMASNYNTRARAAEVIVDDDKVHLIRKREEISDLYAGEQLLP